MTPDDIRVLERLTVTAPLGFRFRDSVTGAIIDDGITATAYPVENPARRVDAIMNRKGVYVFYGLPGMHEVEYPSEDSDPLDDMAGRWTFIVEVVDNQNRFLPANINVKAPVKGLYNFGAASSPPPSESSVLLYSAPSRPVLTTMAIVRAELRDPILKKPASWTLIEAVIDGTIRGRGISDALGRLLLMFPYPELKDVQTLSPVASPPRASPTRLIDQKWSLQLRAFYSPATPVQAIPDLTRIFEQTQAALWFTLSPNTPLGPQTLKYGSELIIASQSNSELWITQTSSP